MKAITTKFHGPTNTRGSRISASDEDGNRIIMSADHSLSQYGRHDAAARALCLKMKWEGCLMRGGVKGGNVYVFIDDSSVVNLNSEVSA